jgi:hypothetical protein
MELEPKHLLPYLPYNLKFKEINYGGTHLLCGIIENELWFKDNYGDNYNSIISDESMKPILRQLSDLTKEIEANGEKFVPSEKLAVHLFDFDFLDMVINRKNTKGIPFWVVQKLFEWHFNVFNLPENLFIDINTLNK